MEALIFANTMVRVVTDATTVAAELERDYCLRRKSFAASSVVVLLQGASHPIPNALPDLLHFSMLESANLWSVVKLIDTEMQGI